MKIRRILALIGVALLILMYLSTLVFSMMTGELATTLFKASVYCTLIIPLFLYVYGMFYKYFKNKGDEMRRDYEEEMKKKEETSSNH